MLHRIITTANGAHTGSSTFASVLHAAAGRAWLKTAPNVTTSNKPGRTRKQTIALAHCPSYSSKSGGNPTLVESSELSAKASPKSRACPLREQPPAPAPTLQHNPNIKEVTAFLPINKIRQQRKSVTPPSVPQITRRTSPKQPPRTPTKSFRFSRAQPSAPRSSDHLPCAPDWSPELAAECTSVTLNPPRRPELLHRLMPLAKSKEELYQNLLHLSIRSQTPPNLAQILDYHDCHSGMRSSSSYNLMLSLALRHSAYGTVHWLFSAMKAESIPYTMETYQHRARFLALLGRWDDVVKEFDLAPTGPNRLQGKVQIPPPIWLELLKARTDAVPGHKFLRKSGEDEGSSGITTEAAQQLAMTYESRFAFLMQNVPDIAMQNLSSNNPRVVAELVTALLRARHGPLALSLAQSYLRGLPSRLPERDAKACMGIIHPLVALLSTQKGLRKFVESRRILRTLLRSHHSLRPTSKTLLLVLSPLKHAKRCATVAANCIEEFVEKWGDAVIDRRVMLRLGSFAVKEGRMDLFNDVSESERLGSWQRPMWQLKGRLIGEAAIPPQDLLRPPTRKFLARKGREERKWCLLEGRARRKKRGEGEGKG